LAEAQEKRTWSDKTGKYKIEGKLKAIEDGKAVLLKSDGKEVRIDVKKLSDADQKYIEAHPPEDGDNPFESSDTKTPSPMPTEGEPKKAKVDWSDVQSIALSPSGEGWKFTTPIEGPQKDALKNKAIPLPPKSNFFEGVSGMAVNHGATRAVVVYSLDEPKPEGTTRLVLCDLSNGKTLLKTSTKGKLAPVALNDKGTQVLMRRAEFGFGNADRLEIWNLSPEGIQKTLVWYPNDDAMRGDRDVKWGAYLADDNFVVLGANGRLAAWKANSAEPLWQMQIDGGSGPAISPDRKLLAFSTGKQVGVLDLKSAEVVALQSTPHTPWPKLCFSPTGIHLACLAHGKLLVWNFADGTLFREIPLAGINVGVGEMTWPHPQYLLLGKSQLFDLENQVKLWSYNGGEAVETVAPGQCAFVVSAGTDKPGALVVGPVPTAAFEKSLAAAKKQPDFLVLKPGTTVKLVLESLQDAQEREKVRAALTAKLKERGCTVGPNGTIELVGTAEAGQERDISYHGFGISPWKTHKVREYISKLTFNYQGKLTWQTQGSSVPGFIQLKEGETIDQVLRRSERPNYTFFEHAELPKVLMKPTGAEGLGTSQVTVSGVQ
jgi:hypothetical protein